MPTVTPSYGEDPILLMVRGMTIILTQYQNALGTLMRDNDQLKCDLKYLSTLISKKTFKSDMGTQTVN